MRNLITKPTDLSLKLLESYITEGDSVIDATAGNGHDTLALAKLVGPSGRVYSFDVQKSALESSKTLLEKEGLLERCSWILASHHRMADYLPKGEKSIAAVVFNLGYLPGGDKKKTTQGATTLPAVRQALDLIRPGGIVSITMYGGHPEGEETGCFRGESIR